MESDSVILKIQSRWSTSEEMTIIEEIKSKMISAFIPRLENIGYKAKLCPNEAHIKIEIFSNTN